MVHLENLYTAYQKQNVTLFFSKPIPEIVALKPELTVISDKLKLMATIKALQKMNGKLFPFGIWHLLHAKKHAKTVTFYLIGVHPDYQNKGVHAIIFDQYTKTFGPLGINNCIRTPELEDNEAINKLWEKFAPITHKRRRTYKKRIL